MATYQNIRCHVLQQRVTLTHGCIFSSVMGRGNPHPSQITLPLFKSAGGGSGIVSPLEGARAQPQQVHSAWRWEFLNPLGTFTPRYSVRFVLK